MGQIDLSIRMKTVADMVISGGVVADIGCDHAFVPIYLIERQIAKKVIASDIRIGPIDIASNNVSARALEKHIDIRMGDGLATIQPKEVDTIIIAGMGGILMNQIMEQQEQVVLSARQLVLQPQSDISLVRKKLRDIDAKIVREEMVVDMGRYYTIIDARLGEKDQGMIEDAKMKQELYDRYGQYLLQKKHPILFEYLQREYACNEKLLENLKQQDGKNAKNRIKEIQTSQQYIDAAFSYYDGDG